MGMRHIEAMDLIIDEESMHFALLSKLRREATAS
jgi:hypothetical protein